MTGVTIEKDGAQRIVTARRGVVLASGGFEHNEPMRKQYQREPTGSEWAVGAKANTGDGILAGQALGGPRHRYRTTHGTAPGSVDP